MGKGDKKTRKGKLTIGSYGVTRPRKKKKSVNTKGAKPQDNNSKAEQKAKAAPKKKAEGKSEAKPKKSAPKKKKEE